MHICIHCVANTYRKTESEKLNRFNVCGRVRDKANHSEKLKKKKEKRSNLNHKQTNLTILII